MLFSSVLTSIVPLVPKLIAILPGKELDLVILTDINKSSILFQVIVLLNRTRM